MVQHTLLVKNVANTLLRVELAKLLGDAHKIVTVSFRNKPGKKGGIKYALVVVESKADLATVIGLIDKKSVNGKELNVTAAKAPHEKGSYVARVARLKQLEKFPNVWPAPTYKNVANSDPLKNQSFPTVYIHGEKLQISPSKTIKKRVYVPSTALYLSKTKGLTRKQILEAFKSVKIRHTRFNTNSGFLIFKDAETRKKAQELAKDNKITIGDHTVQVAESKKFGRKTVETPREVKPAQPAGEKKPLSVNGIAKKRFAEYRRNLFNRKTRLAHIAAARKHQEFKAAVASGKAQPRVVRKLQPKKAIAKPTDATKALQRKASLKAARKAATQKRRAAGKRASAKAVHAKKNKAAPAKAPAAETATA